MSLKTAAMKSIVAFALPLAMATTACGPTLSASSTLPAPQLPGQTTIRIGDSSPQPMTIEKRRRSQRGGKFSWGKAIVLGMVIPSLVAVNMAAGMD